MGMYDIDQSNIPDLIGAGGGQTHFDQYGNRLSPAQMIHQLPHQSPHGSSVVTDQGTFHSSNPGWAIHQAPHELPHRGVAPLSEPRKSADEEFVDDLFALPGEVLGSIFGSNKKPKNKTKPKPKPAKKMTPKPEKSRDIDVESAEAKLRALRDKKNPGWNKEEHRAAERAKRQAAAKSDGFELPVGEIGASLLRSALGFNEGGPVRPRNGGK